MAENSRKKGGQAAAFSLYLIFNWETISLPSGSSTSTLPALLLVGGLGMAFWGYQMSGAFASKLTRGLTGALPDEVMYRYIGGAVSSVAGLFLLVKK